MKETWKDVPGYEGLYQASTLGNIRSLDRWSKPFINHGTICRRRIKGRILKGTPDEDGYLGVDLYDGIDTRPKSCRINRIVAMTYVPNPDNLPQVDHINAVKTDNRPENLEWVTCKENINRAWELGLCSGPTITEAYRQRGRELGKRSKEWTSKPCRCIEDNLIFGSLHEAAIHYHVHSTTIKEWIMRGDDMPHRMHPNLHFEFLNN